MNSPGRPRRPRRVDSSAHNAWAVYTPASDVARSAVLAGAGGRSVEASADDADARPKRRSAPRRRATDAPVEPNVGGLTDRQLMIAGIAGVVLVAIALVMPPSGWLPAIDAVTLGAVEGFTEFLPVSSTGHLLVVGRLLGLGTGPLKEATDTYIVSIQVGAIAAVLGIYRQRIWSMLRGIVGKDDDGRRLFINIVVGFVPAGVVGLALSGLIKDYLFGPWPVIIAWAVGGVFLLVWRPKPGSMTLDMLTPRNALIIGVAQILAMWPGTSRSLVTIVAALAIGMTMASAVEFSFLLGLTTLSAATAFDLIQNGGELYTQFGIATPLLGAAVAFLDAYIAVHWFVSYLRTKPLTIFGWYRIGIAAVTTVLVLVGWV